MVGAMMGNKKDDDDDDDDDAEFHVIEDVSTHVHEMIIRMAASGDTDSVNTVRLTYDLRELRHKEMMSGRAHADMKELAQKLSMPEVQWVQCWVWCWVRCWCKCRDSAGVQCSGMATRLG